MKTRWIVKFGSTITFSPLGNVLTDSRESGICSATRGETLDLIAPVAKAIIVMLIMNPANAPLGECCSTDGAEVPTRMI